MKIRAIIQSRLSSMRLPAKALLPIGGFPAVVLCAKRAQNTGLDVIVATSSSCEDDLLVNALEQHKIAYVRGDLENVVLRINKAIEDLAPEDIVVRLTADNLLPDGTFIEQALAHYLENNYDFQTSTFASSDLPYGMSVEIFRAKHLRQASRAELSDSDKENVTTWIARNVVKKGHFNYILEPYQCLHHIRVTLDTFDDYSKIARVFQLFHNPVQVPWQDLVQKLIENRFDSSLGFGSDFTLGTVQLGLPYGRTNRTGLPNEERAQDIIRQCLKLGVKALDTARAYGVAEERIGQAVGIDKQAQIKVITKLSPFDHVANANQNEIKAMVNACVFESCRQLKRFKLDVLLLHRWQHYQAYQGQIWKCLLELKAKNIIQALGASLSHPNELVEALNDPDIQYIQIPFNILDWRWHSENVKDALAIRPDVKIFARSTLLQGILANEVNYWPTIQNHQSQETIAQLDHFVQKFKRKDRIDLCYAYVRAFHWVSSVVVGVETVEQLFSNLSYFQNAPLTANEAQEIQQVFSKTPVALLDATQWS
ncbi:MAG: aldo/keto reductase [Candidatus Berkiella sp.]